MIVSPKREIDKLLVKLGYVIADTPVEPDSDDLEDETDEIIETEE